MKMLLLPLLFVLSGCYPGFGLGFPLPKGMGSVAVVGEADQDKIVLNLNPERLPAGFQVHPREDGVDIIIPRKQPVIVELQK